MSGQPASMTTEFEQRTSVGAADAEQLVVATT